MQFLISSKCGAGGVRPPVRRRASSIPADAAAFKLAAQASAAACNFESLAGASGDREPPLALGMAVSGAQPAGSGTSVSLQPTVGFLGMGRGGGESLGHTPGQKLAGRRPSRMRAVSFATTMPDTALLSFAPVKEDDA